MAAQQKAVREICRSVWRLTISGAGSRVSTARCGLTQHHKVADQCALAAVSRPLPLKNGSQTSQTFLKYNTATTQMTFKNFTYILPSTHNPSLHDLLVIGDVPATAAIYDCPNIGSLLHISDPTSSLKIKMPEHTPNSAPKEARQILKIRRKKMKRHLLKKYRKRMLFTLRKQRRDRKRKKEAIFQAKLARIQQWGESFSAKDYVMEELHKARRGGFYVNVFDK